VSQPRTTGAKTATAGRPDRPTGRDCRRRRPLGQTVDTRSPRRPGPCVARVRRSNSPARGCGGGAMWARTGGAGAMRESLGVCGLVVVAWVLAAVPARAGSGDAVRKPPNVLIIITDDQGHGDLGVHGNPVIRTPNLDRLARESVRLTRFHVAPVCSP